MKTIAWLSAVALVLLQVGCGGGGGGGGVSMNDWVHVTHPHWDYFKPTDQWIGTESTSGIDISSPTGDADVAFAFAYGPLARFESELRTLGFSPGVPEVPVPHEHYYRSEFDSFAKKLIEAFEWSYSPLRPEDEQ